MRSRHRSVPPHIAHAVNPKLHQCAVQRCHSPVGRAVLQLRAHDAGQRVEHLSCHGRPSHSARVTRRDAARSSLKTRTCARANSASWTLRFASSLTLNERLSKLVDPTEVQSSSTIGTLQWYMVGWYSLIFDTRTQQWPPFGARCTPHKPEVHLRPGHDQLHEHIARAQPPGFQPPRCPARNTPSTTAPCCAPRRSTAGTSVARFPRRRPLRWRIPTPRGCRHAGMLAGCQGRAVNASTIPLTTAGPVAVQVPASIPAADVVEVAIAPEYGCGVDDLLFRRLKDKPALIAQSVHKGG